MASPGISLLGVQADQNRRLTEALERERLRLRNFIRKHVPDFEDAEDILQDVFSRTGGSLPIDETCGTGRGFNGVVSITGVGFVTMSLWKLADARAVQASRHQVWTGPGVGVVEPRQRMSERLKTMTPEQRASLRTGMCGRKPVLATQV